MISFHPFFKTLKERHLSTYKLINDYGLSSSTINRLRHNMPLSTVTLNDLCNILDCTLNDIAVFVPDNENTSKDNNILR